MVGSSVGGFSGRFIPGILTDLIGWRSAFDVVALLTLIAAIIVALTLTRERHFVPSGGLGASARYMVRHIRDPRLIATFAIGFGVLFNFVATFTYIGFHLAAPPYSFSATLIGGLFVTYLASSVVVPWVGRGIALFGRRRLVLGIIAAWIVGAFCGMLCQTVATGYVTMTAKEGRSSAVGLYASIYYVGGSAGAFLGGIAWSFAGWPGCVATIAAMLVIIAAIVAAAWD
jgi:predicted MFS family arabinose efflux permease